MTPEQLKAIREVEEPLSDNDVEDNLRDMGFAVKAKNGFLQVLGEVDRFRTLMQYSEKPASKEELLAHIDELVDILRHYHHEHHKQAECICFACVMTDEVLSIHEGGTQDG